MSDARTHRTRTFAILAAVTVALLLLAPAGAAASVATRISAALERRGMAGSGTSVVVYDLTAREYVLSLRPDVLRLPASNEKLVTSAAALAGWTAAHRFGTQLFVDAPGAGEDGVVTGSVYLRGLGDPSLSTASFQTGRLGLRTADLRDFATELKSMGLTKITGRVVADDGYFDGVRVVPNWRPSMTAYCGPLSALTLNEGFGPGGGYVKDPSLWAASKLTTFLRAAGIRVVHAAMRGVAPVTATLVHTERSARLGLLLAAMNKQSDNFIAEELLKGVGASFGGAGTTAAGAAVATQYLQSIGLAEGYRVRDGSGLSYADKLSAHAVVQILGAMSRRADYAVFLGSLSVAGVDGTLEGRMRGTAAAGNVHGKTGTLSAASSLSGYVTSAGGHQLTFSILMNGSRLPLTRAHAAQDAIAVILAGSRP